MRTGRKVYTRNPYDLCPSPAASCAVLPFMLIPVETRHEYMGFSSKTAPVMYTIRDIAIHIFINVLKFASEKTVSLDFKIENYSFNLISHHQHKKCKVVNKFRILISLLIILIVLYMKITLSKIYYQLLNIVLKELNYQMSKLQFCQLFN